MASKKEQLISLILEADEKVIDAMLTLLQASSPSIEFPEQMPNEIMFQNLNNSTSKINYSDNTQEFNDEINNIFGF